MRAQNGTTSHSRETGLETALAVSAGSARHRPWRQEERGWQQRPQQQHSTRKGTALPRCGATGAAAQRVACCAAYCWPSERASSDGKNDRAPGPHHADPPLSLSPHDPEEAPSSSSCSLRGGCGGPAPPAAAAAAVRPHWAAKGRLPPLHRRLRRLQHPPAPTSWLASASDCLIRTRVAHAAASSQRSSMQRLLLRRRDARASQAAKQPSPGGRAAGGRRLPSLR